MKFLFAAAGGFILTVGIFAGGVAFAVSYLSADPVAVQRAAVNNNPEFLADVRKIDIAAQDYERIAPSPTRRAIDDKARDHAEVEDAATGALPDDAPLQTVSAEHVAWCEQRYRSYDGQNNSYRPYSGGTRECISPYFETTTAEQALDSIEQAALIEPFDQADLGAESVDFSHMDSCSARYRSYRAQDNTYQPYGGGPRVACE